MSSMYTQTNRLPAGPGHWTSTTVSFFWQGQTGRVLSWSILEDSTREINISGAHKGRIKQCLTGYFLYTFIPICIYLFAGFISTRNKATLAHHSHPSSICMAVMVQNRVKFQNLCLTQKRVRPDFNCADLNDASVEKQPPGAFSLSSATRIETPSALNMQGVGGV